MADEVLRQDEPDADLVKIPVCQADAPDPERPLAIAPVRRCIRRADDGDIMAAAAERVGQAIDEGRRAADMRREDVGDKQNAGHVRIVGQRAFECTRRKVTVTWRAATLHSRFCAAKIVAKGGPHAAMWQSGNMSRTYGERPGSGRRTGG